MSYQRKQIRVKVQLHLVSYCSLITDCRVSSSASGSEVSVAASAQTEEKPKATKKRCFTCRKKVGLTGRIQIKESWHLTWNQSAHMFLQLIGHILFDNIQEAKNYTLLSTIGNKKKGRKLLWHHPLVFEAPFFCPGGRLWGSSMVAMLAASQSTKTQNTHKEGQREWSWGGQAVTEAGSSHCDMAHQVTQSSHTHNYYIKIIK